MTDADPWEQRFLDAVTRAAPGGPPAEGYLFRRAVLARRHGPGAGAALIAAAAELLAEEGLGEAERRGCLRAVLTQAPCTPSDDWFWEMGRGDLIGIAPASRAPADDAAAAAPCWVARVSLPAVAVLTLAAMACRI